MPPKYLYNTDLSTLNISYQKKGTKWKKQKKKEEKEKETKQKGKWALPVLYFSFFNVTT